MVLAAGATKLAKLFPDALPAATEVFNTCMNWLEQGNLRLCRTRFQPGWLLTGYSPKLDMAVLRFSLEVLCASLVDLPPVRPVQALHRSTSSTRHGPFMSFLEAEKFGVRPAAECNACKGCK